MKKKFPFVLMTVALASWAPFQVLAQDAPADASVGVESSSSQSFFDAFLWSDDPLGLGLIWFLLLMSFVAISLSIMYMMKSKRDLLLPDSTLTQLEMMLSERRFKEAIDFAATDDSYLGKVCYAALSQAPNGFTNMERALEATADAESTKLLRPYEVLNLMGNIAPMLGLFGTVYGMILAFMKLVSGGGNADPAELAAGISTALVTTFWGLVVAIPALAAYSIVRNKTDGLCSEGTFLAAQIIEPFRPKKKSAGSSSSNRSGGSANRSSPRPS